MDADIEKVVSNFYKQTNKNFIDAFNDLDYVLKTKYHLNPFHLKSLYNNIFTK